MGVVKAGCSDTAPLPNIFQKNKMPTPPIALSIKWMFVQLFIGLTLQFYKTIGHIYTRFLLQNDSDVLHTVHSFKKV